ncbi:hypothetical protein COCNU_scaffold003427G000050 [Cocos nucifera]|nr:hypothetical protein [Cocos nucifera]
MQSTAASLPPEVLATRAIQSLRGAILAIPMKVYLLHLEFLPFCFDAICSDIHCFASIVEGHSIYIGNLPLNATARQVEEEFKKFGPIKPRGVQIRIHKFKHFCLGFIEFESLESMKAAIKLPMVFLTMTMVMAATDTIIQEGVGSGMITIGGVEASMPTRDMESMNLGIGVRIQAVASILHATSSGWQGEPP